MLKNIGHWNWTSTVLGILALVLIFAIQRFVPKVPAALTAVVLASIYVAVASRTSRSSRRPPETAGAKSQMSNIFLAIVVLLTLAFLAPLFQWLPEACLGAVAINVMWGSASPMRVIGVFRVSFPGRAELGRDDKTGEFEARMWIHGAKKGAGDPDARPVPGVMLYRFDAPLIYSNSEAFKQTGERFLIDAAAKGPLPKTLVIDFEEVFYTDVSGAGALRNLHNYADRYGVGISIARLHSAARETLAADGVLIEIGEDRIYDSVQAAVDAASSSGQPEGIKAG